MTLVSKSDDKAEKFYDVVMRRRCASIIFFARVSACEGLAFHPYSRDWDSCMDLAGRVSIAIYLAASICLHVPVTVPSASTLHGIQKITALAGMLFANLILLTPRAPSDVLWIACQCSNLIGDDHLHPVVFDLGRSLSVMPEARKLVTSGLYRHVRHPLYLPRKLEYWEYSCIPIMQDADSRGHFYLQIRRMDWEEAILAKAFRNMPATTAHLPASPGSTERAPGCYTKSAGSVLASPCC